MRVADNFVADEERDRQQTPGETHKSLNGESQHFILCSLVRTFGECRATHKRTGGLDV